METRWTGNSYRIEIGNYMKVGKLIISVEVGNGTESVERGIGHHRKLRIPLLHDIILAIPSAYYASIRYYFT